jgi:hypothetical protein
MLGVFQRFKHDLSRIGKNLRRGKARDQDRWIAAQTLRLQQESYVHDLLQDTKYAEPGRLARHEHQVFSQNGEDGIVAEIFRRIGVSTRTFLEIGAGSGLENNTAWWLMQGWRGFWVEGGARYLRKIQRRMSAPIADGRLTLVRTFVSAENVAGTLRDAGVPEEIDLFSLDIDRNTYWIWAALPRLGARCVVVEYNSTYPPHCDWKVPYDPARVWNNTSFFGASLKALELLGHKFGYALVGCDLTGSNAFFVRQDLVGSHFAAPFTAENHYEPMRLFLLRTHGYPRCAGD